MDRVEQALEIYDRTRRHWWPLSLLLLVLFAGASCLYAVHTDNTAALWGADFLFGICLVQFLMGGYILMTLRERLLAASPLELDRLTSALVRKEK